MSNNRNTIVEITYPLAGASSLALWLGRDHVKSLEWLSPDWTPGIRLDPPAHHSYRPTSRPLMLLTPRP